MDRVEDYDYALPPELIAQHPAEVRTGSRLLKVDSDGAFHDRAFVDLLSELSADDLVVFNNTRVIPARVFGRKASGGKVEILLERILDEHRVLAQVRASRSPKPDSHLIVVDGDAEVRLTVIARRGTFFELEIDVDMSSVEWFGRIGQMPLPPYIERVPEQIDDDRYQTVFGHRLGAVAAPTAGLHFDQTMLTQLGQRGVRQAEVTLHVGAGTYQPVRVASLAEHQMHSEWLEVDEQVCAAVNLTRERGGKVLAVGTTVVRALETAAKASPGKELLPYRGDTQIFIYPGFEFKVVDKLLTNFHLPQSTLLMLVSAFSTRSTMLAAYRHAVAQRYRFFSYGDAMLIDRV